MIMQKVTITDAILVSKYIKGEESALEVLITRHKQRIYSFIYSKVYDRDIAEDIFQDTFIKVIKTLKAGNYSEEGKFLPWVMRIAHNLIIDHFRKEKRMPTYSGTDTFDIFDVIKSEDKNVDQEMFWGQVYEDVKKLVDFLPEEQKQVLNMRLYNEMSFKDIAEETNVSINTALGRMRYALINMRKMIAENNMVMTEE